MIARVGLVSHSLAEKTRYAPWNVTRYCELTIVQYSKFKWNFNHFTGVDYNDKNGKTAIYRIQGDGKNWAQGVDDENNNYDYLSAFSFSAILRHDLMLDVVGADIDYNHPEAREDVLNWGKWVIKETGASGFRFDAVKVCHCSALPFIFSTSCSTSTAHSSGISSKVFAQRLTNRKCLLSASSGRIRLKIWRSIWIPLGLK